MGNEAYLRDALMYPMCLQGRDECIAYRKGGCTILRNTQFKRPCPFFKTADMVYAQLPKPMADDIMIRHGRRKREDS